jgi:Primase C terminal 2 (PriCT-2)
MNQSISNFSIISNNNPKFMQTDPRYTPVFAGVKTEEKMCCDISAEFKITLGLGKTQQVWNDQDTVSFDDFAEELSQSPAGPKDGTCYVPATFRGINRKMNEADEIGIAALDADCGHTLDEILEALGKASLEAIVHSTYSHMTTESEILCSDFDKREAATGQGVAAYMREMHSYLPRVIADAKIVNKVAVPGKAGTYYIVKHHPCPKFRIILRLADPWRAADFTSQAAANAEWQRFIDALAGLLGLQHDQSCTDTSRLFFFPRTREGGPEYEFRHVAGNACSMQQILAVATEDKHNCRISRIGAAKNAPRKVIPLYTQAEAERIRSALSVIPANERIIWLTIGAALHWTGWGDLARLLWDEWSRTSGKFDEAEQEKTWRSFDRGYDGEKVTLGTLFALAKEHGWSDRPARAKSNGLPVIQIKAGHIEQIVDEAERALIASNRGLYQRAGQIVCVGESRVKTKNSGEIMRQTIRERRDHALVEDMTASARFERFDARRKSWVEVDAPMGIAKTLQQRHSRLQLPVLSGVINAPTLRADGSLLVKPGYDPETGLLFDPQGVAFSPIPNKPTREEAKAALGSIKGLIGTFHFVGEADCAVALSAILTAVVRKSAIRQAPMHCFDAPLPGSGKGKLVDITSIIATGKEAGIVAQGRTEEELEKRLGALLFAGDQIAIDNCTAPLGGAFLCALLTQSTVMVRILGKSEVVEVPTDVLATATGNNLRIDGDMTRRVLICRIDPETERPELRKFNNDPVADAKAGRPRLVAAALLVLRAYIAAGKPPQADPLGSYEDWSDLVRSTLMWLGEADPVETMERARETDPRLDEKRAVMAAWAATVGQGKVTARKVSEWASNEGLASASGRILHEALLAIAGFRDEIDTKRLGNWLRANKGARLEGYAWASGLEAPSIR